MSHLHHLARSAAIATLLTATLASAQGKDPQPTVSLLFGVYKTDKATVMWGKFTPFLEALQKSMGQELECDVEIKLKISSTYAKARRALVKGEVDFVRFGPASYVLAKNANPKIELLAMETIKGKRTFKGYIVVRADSKIRNLAQLRGKRFAFGDKTSTIGRYLAQKTLLDIGIHKKDLKSLQYLGRHDKVFKAVQLRDFDAGALKSSTFHKLNTKRELRILASFDNVTKPWVCRAGLEPRLRTAITNALRNMKDKVALRSLKADSLVGAADRDYDVIRDSMLAAQKFSPTVRDSKKKSSPTTRRRKTAPPKPGKD